MPTSRSADQAHPAPRPDSSQSPLSPPEPFLVPFADAGRGADRSGQGGPDAPPAEVALERVCLACGTVGPPEDAFCTNCGRALPPVVAGPRTTPLGRAFGIGEHGDEPIWRHLPMWAYGIVIGAIALVLLAVIVLTQPSGTGPARAPGVPFDGVGYGLSLPSAYSWVHSQGSAGDEWHFQPVGGAGRAIRATVVTDLQPAEQTLEGALGRMESGVPAARRPFVGSPESLALQAGPAYRVTDSAGLDTYVFFKGGRALFVEFQNVPRADEDAVATSVTIK